MMLTIQRVAEAAGLDSQDRTGGSAAARSRFTHSHSLSGHPFGGVDRRCR
jgi:hypothetical protein